MSIPKMQAYDYQIDLDNKIHANWQIYKNILAVSPTGSGKTFIAANVVRKHIGASIVIAHRRELVSQLSLALAGQGIQHRIIGPKKVTRWIISLHVQEYGKNFIEGSAPCAVASVDTLIRQTDEFFNQVTLWVTDEAHHITRANKWGKAVALFPNAKGLGFTATPVRSDGKGLGRHADGVFDIMVLGPELGELIKRGFLSPYRIFCPPNDLNLSKVPKGASGEFSKKPLKQQTRASTITGDVVNEYLKYALGKQGITFVTDVETATEVAAQFRSKGVPTEVLHAGTPDRIRVEITRRFKNGDLLQLVNVDIFGEGVDVPSVSVVSMARATASMGLYLQQLGRALRVLSGKTHALIIDHVGNVMRHGLPDTPRVWTLDRRDKRASSKSGLIPIKVCPKCTSPYEATHSTCPFCGYVILPANRSKPEYVDGDLIELSPDVLAAMRGEVARIDAPESELREKMRNAPFMVTAGACKQHRKRQEAQQVLRESIAWWSGHHPGTLSESYRRFYFTFGVDVESAKALGRPDAESLTIRINQTIDALVKSI